MKQVRLTAMIAFITLAAVSCKKESAIEPKPVAAGVAKNFAGITYFYDGAVDDAYTYKYDNAGRLLTIANDKYTDYFEYPSAAKLKVIRKTNAGNEISRTYEGELNASGAVVLLTGKDKNGALLETTTINYNGEGYLVSHHTESAYSSYGREYVIEDGMLKTEKKFNNGVQTGNGIYKVDGSVENRQNFTPWGYWSAPALFGKRLKFVVTENIEYNNAGAIQWHTKMSYERDAQGNVTKQNIDYVLEGKKGSTVYKY